MARTKGAKNVAPFDSRTVIPVSTVSAIQLRRANLGPLEQFKAVVDHQRNYLNWLESRHDKIIDLNDKLAQAQSGQPPKRKGAKDATHRKYVWFAECMALLDVINSFEFFYKSSCISLAQALTEVIPASQIKGSVEARFLWQSLGYSVAHLVFEHKLFHDLEAVDDATKMLIQKPYYSLPTNKDATRCIRAIFQIRHTLSHNSGQMTHSDSTKLRALGLDATQKGAIDPTDGQFTEAVFRYLIDEAAKFTKWLETETAKFLTASPNPGPVFPVIKARLLMMFPGSTAFDALNLIEGDVK